MAEWLSPAEEWPRHTRGGARQALADARRLGWWFRPAAGHSFGRLACGRRDRRDPESDSRCELTVLSTAGGDAEDTANLIREAIDGCPHRESSDHPGEFVAPPLDSERERGALKHLLRAEKLITGLEQLVVREARRRESEELLDRAADIDTQAEVLLHQALESDAEAALAESWARQAVDDVGYSTNPFPPDDISVLSMPAQEALDSASATLAETGGSADDLRERIEEWRDRLDAATAALLPGDSDDPSVVD